MSNNNNAIPSPEEWLKRRASPHMRSCMEQGLEPVLSYQEVLAAMRDYAAHIAATAGQIENIHLRAVYPAPTGEEKQMMTIDVVCQACKTEYCINVPTTIGDFSTECPECGIDVYVYIDSIVEETPGGENITNLPAEEINRLVDHITDVIIEDEQNREG